MSDDENLFNDVLGESSIDGILEEADNSRLYYDSQNGSQMDLSSVQSSRVESKQKSSQVPGNSSQNISNSSQSFCNLSEANKMVGNMDKSSNFLLTKEEQDAREYSAKMKRREQLQQYEAAKKANNATRIFNQTKELEALNSTAAKQTEVSASITAKQPQNKESKVKSATGILDKSKELNVGSSKAVVQNTASSSTATKETQQIKIQDYIEVDIATTVTVSRVQKRSVSTGDASAVRNSTSNAPEGVTADLGTVEQPSGFPLNLTVPLNIQLHQIPFVGVSYQSVSRRSIYTPVEDCLSVFHSAEKAAMEQQLREKDLQIQKLLEQIAKTEADKVSK